MTRLSLIKESLKRTPVDQGDCFVLDIRLRSQKAFANRNRVTFIMDLKFHPNETLIIDKKLLSYRILKNNKLKFIEPWGMVFRADIADVGESVLEDI